jgi:hypothetical protein
VRRKSTRLKILFFGVLVAAFIGIQYSWVRSMQKDKLQQFKSLVVSGINVAGGKLPIDASIYDLADTAIAGLLQQSFLSKGLANLRFEFSLDLDDQRLTSAGFLQKQADTANNLVLHYVLQRTGEKPAQDKAFSEPSLPRYNIFSVMVPSWKKRALGDMGWLILGSVLLTVMIVSVFVCASMISNRKQPLYDSKTMVIQNMMQQLEAPLSSVSVAAEALRNAKVKHDPGKIDYYQQVITEESQRMNEHVEKFLREIKK